MLAPREPDDVAVDVDPVWPCFMAKLREVAALWAMIRMKQEKAIPTTLSSVVHA